MSFYSYSILGYYSDKVIIWFWMFMTLVGIIWFWKFQIIKMYLGLLFLIMCLSFLQAGIPFFGIVYFSSTIGDYQHIELNNNFRIEKTKPSALDAVKIIVYQEKGLFEKEVSRIFFSQLLDELNLPSFNDENILIQSAEVLSATKDIITIDYILKNNYT